MPSGAFIALQSIDTSEWFPNGNGSIASSVSKPAAKLVQPNARAIMACVHITSNAAKAASPIPVTIRDERVLAARQASVDISQLFNSKKWLQKLLICE